MAVDDTDRIHDELQRLLLPIRVLRSSTCTIVCLTHCCYALGDAARGSKAVVPTLLVGLVMHAWAGLNAAH